MERKVIISCVHSWQWLCGRHQHSVSPHKPGWYFNISTYKEELERWKAEIISCVHSWQWLCGRHEHGASPHEPGTRWLLQTDPWGAALGSRHEAAHEHCNGSHLHKTQKSTAYSSFSTFKDKDVTILCRQGEKLGTWTGAVVTATLV